MSPLTSVRTFGEVDRASYEQLVRCMAAGDSPAGVLCADHHKGYSQPIGGVVAYPDYISPSGVGYDIGCGNKAVRTNLVAAEIRADMRGIMDEVVRQVAFGMGRNNPTPVDASIIDAILHCSTREVSRLHQIAANQLGTVGSGNHYVDIFHDEDGYIWVGVHFGSRGFGHKVADGFLALSQGLEFDARASEGEMDADPTLIRTNTPLGDAYIEAMELAGAYAYAGRDYVCKTVVDILGGDAMESVHNHHNYAWLEDGLWVIRKGATPLFPGQRSFIGGSMGDISVIVEGVDTPLAKEALYSTVHGAGRVMSRTQAAGKFRKIDGRRQRDPSTAAIDWQQVKRDQALKGIVTRGGGADEAPAAYKRIEEVLDYHSDYTKIVHTLTPMGVAMAGEDVFDPYKD